MQTTIKNKAKTTNPKLDVLAQVRGMLETRKTGFSIPEDKPEKALGYSLTVSAEDWQRYLKLCSEKASLEKEIKKLKEGFGVPAGAVLCAKYGLTEGEKGVFSIVNGNGDEVGKGSVSFVAAFVMPDSWRVTLS